MINNQAELVTNRLCEIFGNENVGKLDFCIVAEIGDAVEQSKCFMIRKINDK